MWQASATPWSQASGWWLLTELLLQVKLRHNQAPACLASRASLSHVNTV